MVTRAANRLIPLLVVLMPSILQAEQDTKILVMAHRGGKGLWPENTIYGYRNALESGVDVLEIDIWRTKDNVVVVNHDERVDRTTDGRGEVRSLTLAELQALDAGYRWSLDGTYPYRGASHTIPTLNEVLTQFPDARFNIDIKENSAELIDGLCDLIREHNAGDRVLIASFHQGALRRFRKHCPGVPTSAGKAEISRFLILSKLHLTFLYTPSFSAFQVPVHFGPITVVDPTFVDAAHSKGLEVHPWTINDLDEMRRLIAMDVDGIITDHPDRLVDVLQENRTPEKE